jgi:two-component system, sensor histidine kinase and response regulator
MQPQATGHKWTYVLDEPARILVVDDDSILREFAIVHLSTPSAAVETAADGKAGLDLLLMRHFDIVLADISMPGLDGFELVERVREHEKLRHIPIVMLTCHESIADIDRAYRVGATSFATKPVNWRQLSYHLRYVLRASRGQADQVRTQVRTNGGRASAGDAPSISQNEMSASLEEIIELANQITDNCGRDRFSSHIGYATSIAAAARHALGLVRGGADCRDLSSI